MDKNNSSTSVESTDKWVACNGCGVSTVALLSCPTCRKLNLAPAYFCNQKCFQTSWPKHKMIHRLIKNLQEQIALQQPKNLSGVASLAAGFSPTDTTTWVNDLHLRRFVNFSFTGDLRPWPTPVMRVIPETAAIVNPDYALDLDNGIPESEVKLKNSSRIEVQTPENIAALRECCSLARQALDVAGSMVAPGVTTEAIDLAVHNFCVEHNAYPSPLNYYKFPKSCCTSVNEVICHGIPDLRPLENGDIVNIDITLYYKTVHGDLNETFQVGNNVDADSKRLVQGAYDCLMTAVKMCKPGVMYRELGDIIASVADEKKLSVVRSYCGHGVGKLFHTAPNVPHYRKNKATGIMRPGHVFTIEPMINLGTHKDRLWPDDWTAVTMDGKRSAQFEHTLLITDTGVDVLTARFDTSPSLEIDAWS